MKQQDTIGSLDAELLSSYREIESLRQSNALLTQDKAALLDQLLSPLHNI